MTTETINQQFEAAFVRKYGFGRMTASSNDEAMAMYAAAYWAWNEALKSVVVELPAVKRSGNAGHGWLEQTAKDEYRKECRAAIESAGVRVKE